MGGTNTYRLALAFICWLAAAPATPQNLISRCEIRHYPGFVRLALEIAQPPRFTTNQPEAGQTIDDELQILFSDCRLARPDVAPVDSLLEARMRDLEQSRSVQLRIRLAQPFTFNAFYFSPRRVFIVDVVPAQRPPGRPAPPLDPMDKGIRALARGDTSGAIQTFQDLLVRSPMHAAANFYMGLIRAARGDVDMARQNFLRAARADSRFENRATRQLAKLDALGATAMDLQGHGGGEQIHASEISADDFARAGEPPLSIAMTSAQVNDGAPAQTRPQAETARPRAEPAPPAAPPSVAEEATPDYIRRVQTTLAGCRDWIHGHRQVLWQMSVIFALAGITLLVSHWWSAARTRQSARHAVPAHSFSSLVAESMERSEAQPLAADAAAAPTTAPASVPSTFVTAAPPFDLPAPLVVEAKDWPDVASRISRRLAQHEHPAAIARKLDVGLGEVELYSYLERHGAADQDRPRDRMRLTFAER